MANFFKSLLPYAAGALTGGVMGQFSATAPFAAAGSAAAGALTNSKNRLGGALQGFAGGGIGSAIGGGIAGKNGFGAGAMEGLKSYGNSIPGFGGVGTSNPTGALAKFFTPQSIQNPGINPNSMTVAGKASFAPAPYGTNFKMPNLTAPVTGATTGAGTSAPAAGGMFKNLFGGAQGTAGAGTGTNWAGVAGGAAIPAVVSALSPKVSAPDLSSISGPLKDQVNNTYANSAAKAYYNQQLSNPIGVDSTNGLAVDKLAHDKQLEENLRSFDQQWKASMGGQDMTNNSEYQTQRQKMIQDSEANWTAQQAQTQFQYDQQQQQNKQAAAVALQGMDDSQLNALAGLAQYDLTTIMAQFQMDATSAQQIQELAATASSLIMQKSLGLTGAAAAPVKAA